MSDPFHVRQALLHTAQTLLLDKFHSKAGNYPTVDAIIEVARQYNEFISNDRPRKRSREDYYSPLRSTVHELIFQISLLIPEKDRANNCGTFINEMPEYLYLVQIRKELEALMEAISYKEE